jgi:hypothetical protein
MKGDSILMAGTPQVINAQALGTISNLAADKIVAALDRNTAALLTVAAEVLAYSTSKSTHNPLAPDEIKQEVLTLFNRFSGPINAASFSAATIKSGLLADTVCVLGSILQRQFGASYVCGDVEKLFVPQAGRELQRLQIAGTGATLQIRIQKWKFQFKNNQLVSVGQRRQGDP